MTVYADILIILNTAIDFLLLLCSSKILRKKIKTARLISASLLGGLSSLYIFAPDYGAAVEIAFKITVCAALTLISFGYGTIKTFLRSAGILFLVTCGWGGILIALYYMFKPHGMIVENSIVYFNISPTVLIVSSVAAYLLFFLLSAIFSRNSELADTCDITVFADGESVTFSAVVDTGNSINDVLGNSEVIIADKVCAETLFGSTDTVNNEKLRTRYRVMPCSTVSGCDILDSFRCDRATVNDGEHMIEIEKPILAVSKIPIKDGCQGIVNPKIFR